MYILGKNISLVLTLSSHWDEGKLISLKAGDTWYKMNIDEFMKIISHLVFSEHKKRVHTYLELENCTCPKCGCCFLDK